MNCHAVTCMYSAAHALFVLCIVWWISVLMFVSGLLRLDRVPQACRNVRTRSTTLVRRLLRVVLLPSGISGKMTISPDTITIIAMLVYRFYRICLVAYHMLNISLSTMPWNLQPVRPSKPLIGYVTACLTMLLALLLAGVLLPCENMGSLSYHHINCYLL